MAGLMVKYECSPNLRGAIRVVLLFDFWLLPRRWLKQKPTRMCNRGKNL